MQQRRMVPRSLIATGWCRRTSGGERPPGSLILSSQTCRVVLSPLRWANFPEEKCILVPAPFLSTWSLTKFYRVPGVPETSEGQEIEARIGFLLLHHASAREQQVPLLWGPVHGTGSADEPHFRKRLFIMGGSMKFQKESAMRKRVRMQLAWP